MSSQLLTFDELEPALAYLADPQFGPLLDDLGHEATPASELRSPWRELLAHDEHMTVVLERHHGRPVDLRVVEDLCDENIYTRLIQLAPRGSERVVETGIVRLNLGLMSAAVRAEILARSAPLGDILIRHDVLRRIEPLWFLRLSGSSRLLTPFGPAVDEAFGRVGIIHCDDQPAIELLEIVANA